MAEDRAVGPFRWDDMEMEPMADLIHRRVISGEGAMIVQILLRKGAVVPAHSHEVEQLSYLLEGTLKLWIGEEREEVVLRGGDVLVIPPGVLHAAEAMEDCVDLDVFSPPRQEWLEGANVPLRKE